MHWAIEVPSNMTGDEITWLWSNETERFVPIEGSDNRKLVFDRTVK